MDTSQYKPRSKWPLFLGLFTALLLVLYFVVSSGAFLRAVVLPRVAAALHSELTVEDIALSPFSSLTLRKLKLTPTGAETLATVEEVRLRYSLLAILGGNLKITEVTMDTPVVTVVGRADGKSNLSGLLAPSANNQGPAEPKAPGAPPKVDVRNISLKNGTLRQSTAATATNAASTVEITGLNVTLNQLANSGNGQLTISSDLSLTLQSTNRMTAKTDGSFKLGVDEKLQPKAVNGVLNVASTSASGAFREFAKVGAKLTVDTTVAEIREVRLAISESGQAVGELRLSGPFDFDKKEARIAYELKGLDRKALGIVGAVAGVDLGETRLSAEGRIDLAQRGQLFASFGKVTVNRLSVGTAAGRTPVLDLALDYKMQLNLENKTALFEKADLSVQQGPTQVVRGQLDRPMNIAWDTDAPGFREATYSLSVKRLDLAPWRAVAGPGLPAGLVSFETSVTSDRDGRLLKFTVSAALDQVAVATGDRTIRDLALTLRARGSVEDFKVVVLEQADGEVLQSGQSLAKYNVIAHVNLRNRDIGGQASVEAALPAILRAYPVDGVKLTVGGAQLTAQVSVKPGQTNGSIGLSLTGLTGEVFGAVLRDYEAKLDGTGTLAQGKAILQRGALSLRSGSSQGGSLDFSGDYDLNRKRGQSTFKTVDLNETAVGPFVASAIRPNELRSVSLDLTGNVQLDLSAQSTLKTALKVSRLVARDPSGRLPETPLAFGVDLDAAQRGQNFELRQLLVTLPPTARAKNELRASGKLDFATNNAAPSSLSLTSAGLDLTPVYNLLAGGSNSAPSAPTAPKPAGKSGEPVKVPLEQLTLDAKLDAVFLREIAVSNLVMTVATHHSKVVVNPFSLMLNGAPVTATAALDLGVPGYTYDVSARLQSVPIPPLAKSFLSGDLVELHGRLDGKAAIQGAGVEGAALRQHLAGNLEFAATNLDYKVTALKTPFMKMLVSTLSSVLNLPSLSESPLNSLAARLEASQGVINVTTGRVSSAAFLADVQGKIQLADVITNSPINIPVTVSLPKAGKMEALPSFLTMKGTLGAPKPDIDALAVARVLTHLPGAGGSALNLGVDQLGSALDKALGGKGATNGVASGLLKGFLGGTPTNAPAAAATNAPAAPFNPLDLLKKRDKK